MERKGSMEKTKKNTDETILFGKTYEWMGLKLKGYQEQIERIKLIQYHIRHFPSTKVRPRSEFEVHFQTDSPELAPVCVRGESLLETYKKASRIWREKNAEGKDPEILVAGAEVLFCVVDLRLPVSPEDVVVIIKKQSGVTLDSNLFGLDERFFKDGRAVWDKISELPSAWFSEEIVRV
jgi:hypothetical protein